MKPEKLNKEIFLKIIEKFLEGKCTKEEHEFLINYYESFQNDQEWHKEYGIEKEVKEIIHLRILNSISESELPQRKTKKLKLIWKYAAAASIAVLLATSLFFNFKNETFDKQSVLGKNDIKIGTNKAILTLENGEQVQLEKGKEYNTQNAKSNGEQLIYAEKADSQKNKKEEMAYNILTIPRGGEFFIQLEDKTKVWLNADSKLKYPVKFIDGQPRKVEVLYGEAYFEVSPSKDHHGDKFQVLSKGQSIEVLGTKFNIKAYTNDNTIETVLVEGKVAVSINNKTNTIVPDEQVVYHLDTKTIDINTVNALDHITWKLGFLRFDNKSLGEISKVLERWYNVEFIFKNKDIEQLRIKGVLSKYQNIEFMLISLKELNEMSYEIIGNKIYIK